MDFAMKDFDFQTVTGDSTVNVQHKKPFDIADVDNNAMKIENDEWNIDSIFPLNTDFLNDFNDFGDLNMDKWTDAYDYMSSPTSTGTESENDHDMVSIKPIADQMLSPPQKLMSSSSSDSGLSSDHVDFDMNFDQMASDLSQQPLLSSQIIPEIADEEFQIEKPGITETMLKKSIKSSQSNTSEIIKQNVTPIQIKTKPIEQTVSKQNIQYIKRASTNVVQMSDIKQLFKKQNGAIISENVVANNTPLVINKVNGNITGIRKLVHVKKGPNQKSIILPFSLKDGTDIRSIKIIKPSTLAKSPKILMAASNLLQEYKQNTIIVNKPVKLEPKYEIDSMSEPSDCESYKFEEMFVRDDEDDYVNNDSDQEGETKHQSEYPKLMLSGEEKRLLAKEGITLPAHYPLTKHEERELKRIRRKIRNKISAQDSRKRKKEYVDGLEERVKKCTDENQTLVKRIKLLQTQNQNLVNQMKKMQSLLSKCGNKSAPPATCLMVLLMSMALIAAPNLKMNKDGNDGTLPTDLIMEENQMQQNRRSLLFDSREKFGDAVADEEMSNDFGLFCKTEDNEHNYASWNQFNKDGDLIDTLDLDDDDPPNRTSHHYIPAEPFDNRYDNRLLMKDNPMNINGLNDNVSPVTHVKTAKNLSDLSSVNSYQLKIDANGIPNIVSLNTEVDSKNV